MSILIVYSNIDYSAARLRGDNILKTIYFLLITVILISCVPKTTQETIDINQYFKKTIYKDSNALYIGEWTAVTPKISVSIKINNNGHIKMCYSNPHIESINGKIHKENDKIKMIFESGFQLEILTLHKDYVLVKAYDKEYKYFKDNVPDTCKALFDTF